jgi:cyclic pyranopterin phosphate synthase
MSDLTHTNSKGEAQMVDVADKNITTRIATASCLVLMKDSTLQQIKDNSFKKGDVLAVARVAGIMAAKKTADLIPMCHQLNLSKVSVDFEFINDGIKITTMAKLDGKTGVEMEALTACTVAGLTIYDMCKAVDRFMQITEVKMLEKSGGKSGDWKNNQ